MLNTVISPSVVDSPPLQVGVPLSQCTLLWRQGQLLVKDNLQQQARQPLLPALTDVERLEDCLKHSPVQLVQIDATLGESTLQMWANACQKAKKAVFIHIPLTEKLSKRQTRLSWQLKRLIDWAIASMLLAAISPTMLIIIVLMQIFSPGPIFSQQWYVGRRGKLFQALKFRTTQAHDSTQLTHLGAWLCKYQLEGLPQLFNVLRGDLSLIESGHLSLSEAVRLSFEVQLS